MLGPQESLERREWYIRKTEVEQSSPPLIGVVGAQGVGKSTVAELVFGRLPRAKFFAERWEEVAEQLRELNALKALVYRGEATADQRIKAGQLALEVELYFLHQYDQRASEIVAQKSVGPGIFDTSPWTDPLYVETYREFGVMTEEQYGLYLAEFKQVIPTIPTPDFLLGLKVSPDNLIDRWRRRLERNGERDFEAKIPAAQFRRMAEISNAFIDFTVQNGWPMLLIDTNTLDFANNGDHKKTVVSLVLRKLKTHRP